MLFDNEKIVWGKTESGKTTASDNEINEKYLAGEVRIVTEQARYPLDTIAAMVSSDKYVLMPTFQRRHRWSLEKKSRLIESFIMNVPIPPVFLYETEFSHYEVMDGLQRMTAIFEFYTDKFALTGLELWSELNGKKYSELPEKIKQGIDRRYLSSIILLQESAKSPEKAQEMKQLVFERINSGGVKLEPQETRNALYNGPMNELCSKLSENKYLRYLFDIPHRELVEGEQMATYMLEDGFDEDEYQRQLDANILYQSMSDIELVLRFFAMRNLHGYMVQFHRFLDDYLVISNGFGTELLSRLENVFEDTIEFAYDLLGKKAFYLWRSRRIKGQETWRWFERSTTTVYDPLMYTLSEFLAKKDILMQYKDQIQEDIKTMYSENYKTFEGRSSNRSDIESRIRAYQEFFGKYLGR